MRKSLVALAAAGLLATVSLTACDDGADSGDDGTATTASGEKSSGEGGVGVILPDTKSSQRWSTDDPRYLERAFEAAKVPFKIRNAEGDREQFKRIAEELLDDNIKVLLIANLDSVSGKAVIDNAKRRGVSVIDYDRLTLNGGADYYVSFDNEQVGVLQGRGLTQCLAQKKAKTPVVAQLNGSLTDNNATLFKAGYDSVLQPLYDSADYIKGPDQFVQDWDNDEGRAIFAQMLKQFPNIKGVLAANDGLGNAAIEVLREKNLNGVVPVTGQDATVQGLQNILAGDQCMTVYKAVKKEADAAANLAIELFKGVTPAVKDKIKDPESGAYVPFVSLAPEAITAKNVKRVVDDGFITKQSLCTKDFAQACRRAGIKDPAA
ncbi:sugar ABC transporter substrate-binding protein [Actinoplanes aureus]|uniref:Substrate-binding domain-containing protein n=1 Tax=Actinoplanes aureus TaxID=2792083 RepID=A0A931FVC9_9ACTN|nr:substrate-binding domain-containing protein [Actinoplanes aureus]MBG0561193.1 substrate-binding domain-containing protein [Actinoplanes aureus]